MLQITIPKQEMYDETTEEFVYTKERTIMLEHSLVSLSKWESKWNKPFLSDKEKTLEETIDYVRCMTITQNVENDAYKWLTQENIDEVNEYIKAPMTATWFSDDKKGGRSGKQITSELIYYWMIALNIPIKCEKWHLNRLLTLVKVCEEEQKPAKKMSEKQTVSTYAALNDARRKALKSKG